MEIAQSWIFFALLASALGAVGILLEKILITKNSKDWIYLTSFLGILNFTPALIFLGFSGPGDFLPLAFISGVFYRLANFAYIKALSLEEASRVAPLWLSNPAFVLILEAMFLNELLGLNHIVGFVVVLLGSFIIMWNGPAKKLSSAFYLMLGSSLIFAISDIFAKIVSYDVSTFYLVFWIFLGSFVTSVPVFIAKFLSGSRLFIQKDKLQFIIPAMPLIILLVMGSYYYAIKLGPVSLVALLGTLDGVFVFLYAVPLAFIAPALLKEKMDRKALITKSLAIIVIIVGVIFINGGI